ncbi:hypothetical protein VTN00DRAFT_3977 [Thermoascus crustaceus]|uniref:uncharacterized protein n=1 Tax=Thermoascus crustaceus TaxID=5088 RepID=UPI003743C713
MDTLVLSTRQASAASSQQTDDLARILYRAVKAHDSSVDSSPRLKPGAVDAGLPVPTGGLEAGPRRRRGLNGRGTLTRSGNASGVCDAWPALSFWFCPQATGLKSP